MCFTYTGSSWELCLKIEISFLEQGYFDQNSLDSLPMNYYKRCSVEMCVPSPQQKSVAVWQGWATLTMARAAIALAKNSRSCRIATRFELKSLISFAIFELKS